jgi:hypothetical protein
MDHYGGGLPSLALIVYTGLFSFFIGEYMLQERVHLYTYDLFAEKMGFKLCWYALVCVVCERLCVVYTYIFALPPSSHSLSLLSSPASLLSYASGGASSSTLSSTPWEGSVFQSCPRI